MERRYLFDEAVRAYDAARPGYDAQLFEDIVNYANITAGQQLIEVGCGTGQATKPFLDRNCSLTAIELGSKLAAYTKAKFSDCQHFDIIHAAFEDYECESERFDMLFSATAFHWIPSELGYPKARRIIKSGGTMALFWNTPSVNIQGDPLHRKIQLLYERFVPEWNLEAPVNDDRCRQSTRRRNEIASYGFIDLAFKLYNTDRTVTGQEYVELLNTYSDHRSLDDRVQKPFFQAIKDTIEDCGDQLVIHDTVDLYLARNP